MNPFTKRFIFHFSLHTINILEDYCKHNYAIQPPNIMANEHQFEDDNDNLNESASIREDNTENEEATQR